MQLSYLKKIDEGIRRKKKKKKKYEDINSSLKKKYFDLYLITNQCI